MINTETESAQNIVSRLKKEIYLNVPDATTKIKRKYSKVLIAIEKLHCELDELNDIKEKHRDDQWG